MPVCRAEQLAPSAYPLANSRRVLGESGVAGLSLKIVITSLSSLSSKVERA